MRLKDWWLDFARGASLGSGILPGVSVGTIGIIVNVYEKLLEIISDLTKHFFKAFLRLLPIALGCIITAVLLLWGYSHVKNYIPFEIVCLCGGVTLGGLPVIYWEVAKEKPNPKRIILCVVGFVVASMVGIGSVLVSKFGGLDFNNAFLNPNQNWWIYILVAIVGMVAAVACLLPGISGSMVLFIFGLYNPVVELYTGSNSIFRNNDRLASGLFLTLSLFLGVVFALIAFSKLMKSLLEKHRPSMFYLIFGFVIGSIISIFINNQSFPLYGNIKPYHYVFGAMCFVFGCLLILFLLLYSKKRKEGKEDAEIN